MLLMPTGAIVMGKPKNGKDWDRDDHDDHKGDHKGNDPQLPPVIVLPGQIQGQAQGQLQGQAQYQTAVQSVDTKVDNDNKNENDNDNDNKNENKNENSIDNKLDNSIDNKVENKVDNSIDNKVENHVENKVDVKVDVDIDLKIDGHLGLGSDNDYIDVDKIEISDIKGSVVSAEAVYQSVSSGNAYNLDQVNNLADNDFLWKAEVKNDAKFEVDASGGDIKFDDPKIDVEVGDLKGDANTVGDMVSTTADGIANVEAFTQNIVLGANIQFNNIEIGNSSSVSELDDPTG
jgi:hypothetical protein